MRKYPWIAFLLLALMQGNAHEAAGTSAEPGANRSPDRPWQVAAGPLPRSNPAPRTLGPNIPATRAPSSATGIIRDRPSVPYWQQIKVQVDGVDWGGGLFAVGQCGTKNITVRGKRLNLISGVRIVDSGGKDATAVKGNLNWPSFKQGGVEKRMILLEADCNAAPGSYRLELHQRAGPIQNGTAGLSVVQRAAAPPPVRNATVSSAMVHEAFRSTLMAAFFLAHSCGPHDRDRKTMILFPPLGIDASRPLSRFERKTTPNERIAYWTARANTHTVCAVRSCVNGWAGTLWSGNVTNGKIVVRLDIQPNHGFRNRGLYGDVCEVRGQDIIIFPWGWDINDGEVPDRLIDTLRFSITLQPTVDSRGQLSYGNVSVSHTVRNTAWDLGPPFNFIPTSVASDLSAYRSQSFHSVENALKQAFENSTLREKFSDEVMSRLNGISTIKSAGGSGSNINVTY